MDKIRLSALISVLALFVFSVPGLCQVSAVNGSLAGTVYDTSGAVIPGAVVVLTGPTANQSMGTDSSGSFFFHALTPGAYGVTVKKSGFKAYKTTGVNVNVNQVTTLHVTLQVGAPTQTVEVTSPSVVIDTSSTNTTSNITDTAYTKLPIGRNISSLFYLAPGVANGLGTGKMNPSISGGSGLENTYLADGVNITDPGYHAFGIWSQVYGAIGTGMQMSFVKEVDVNTASFKPEYGGSTGGVVQIVTKSGTSEYHGAIVANFAPEDFEATRLQPDNFGLVTKLGQGLHEGGYDVSGEFGGPVPGVRKHLFFFGSFDPTWDRIWRLAPPASALLAHGPYMLRTNTYNYASKITYQINDDHRINFSYFGSPSHTGNSPWRSLTADNNTRFSSLDYGSRNLVAHYTGTLSPTWLVSGDFSWNHSDFTEYPSSNLSEIYDLTQTAGLPGQRGAYTPVGLGFEQNTLSDNYGMDVSTTKMFNFLGGHTLRIGYHYEMDHYNGDRLYSGPLSAIPATNAAGIPVTAFGVPPEVIGQKTNAAFYLRREPTCSLCPLMSLPGYSTMQPVALEQSRGLWGTPNFATTNEYNAGYIQDTWKLNKYITLDFGLRTEQQRMTGVATHYSFTDNWLPNIGVTWDPTGSRKTKVYANFVRLDYVLPLDMALRSLSSELDFQDGYFAPAYTTNSAGQKVVTINQYGTVTPIIDAAHFLTGAPGGVGSGVFVGQQGVGESISPGTKMEYNDEYTVGVQRELPHGVIFSARYIDRRLKRLIEDGSGVPPEMFYVEPLYYYTIGNLGATTDLFVNPIEHLYTPTYDSSGNLLTTAAAGFPQACIAPNGSIPYNVIGQTNSVGQVVGSACFNPTGVNGGTPGAPTPDGVPDGFPNAIRNYDAVEIEFNKSFSNNWLLTANWRIAKLYGNYEGAFRNDNGQADPGISSLYDFTPGMMNLLGDQFAPGPLNSDRLHIVNFYAAYTVPTGMAKGLTLGPGITFATGIPINKLAAHPAYLNSGEVPLGGRGSLGRTAPSGAVNMHLDYTYSFTERYKLDIGWDFFNIANKRTLQYVNQNIDLGYGTPNPDFKKPDASISLTNPTFQRPFHMRGVVRFMF